ncbi:thioredoxin family protein [Patescibacteria group bacterium]|nr:thioredoxin family protein [Patescibacteria group bacterium]
MNKTFILVALVIVLGGGALFFLMPKDTSQNMQGDAMMEKTDDAMMQKDGDAMMEKDGEVMMQKDGEAMMEKTDEGAMMSAGSYEAYAPEKLAKAQNGDVVLFFRAAWCPTCRALDADIRANLGAIPANVTILDVNYDDSTALKQKYGVTYQHTFVQVDANGNQIAKWTKSPTLASLVSNIK